MAGRQANGTADGGKGDEEVVLTPVGDGADEQAARADDGDGGGTGGESETKDEGKGGEGEEDRRLGASDEDREDEEGDEGTGGADRDRRATRPRLSRRERNDLRRRSKERDRAELRFLRTRNEQLERSAMENARRLDALEKGQTDGKIGQIKGAIQRADATFVKATAAGDEVAALEATTLKNSLTEQLRREEERRSANAARQQERQAERSDVARPEGGGLPPEVQRNVQAWMARNPWFDPEMGDRDSRFARALDEEILAEGLDPSSPEYYRELDRRIADEFPHLAKSGRRDTRHDDDKHEERDTRETHEERGRRSNGRKPSGPRFRVGGVERSLRSNEVYVTEERRKALEEMGVWDDIKLRNKYLASYKDWDEQQAAQSRR